MNTSLTTISPQIKTLLSQTPIIMWTTDTNLYVTASSKSDEFIGKTLFDYFQTKDEHFMPIAAHRKALAGETQHYNLEWSGLSYESTVSPCKDSTGNIVGVLGITINVTERKLLEAQFQASQKMESLGRLAGGIAHDFNNLLTVILNYTELLEDDLKDDKKAKPRLEAIANCANKAASLTNQLLAFSRQQVMKEQTIDVNVVLTSLAHMLTRVIGEDIEFKLQLKENLAKISADPSQIVHIIMTLAHYAREAMKQGGQLTISTDFVQDQVIILVHDTGVGMDAETQKNIFEPFFGEGAGLSLAAIFGTVKQSHGNITVDSAPSKGTTFRISFPVALTATESTQEQPMTHNTKTILVVEDEDIVRQVACDIIRGSGFNVLEARSALSALELCDKSKEQVDLVLTDLVMPKMNGPELVKKLSLKFPNLSVVYMSGYSSDAAMGNGILKEKASFVQKPFMPKTLIKALQDTLDGQTVAVA